MNSIYDFTVKTIDGKSEKLEKYKGKAILLVNVASKCGFTPQYEGLETLYKNYGGKDFVILGFPANNFLKQEPATDNDIKQFCSLKYNVSFPMFSKISVKGKDIAPLYKFVTEKKGNPSFHGKIKWNFTKILINKDGHIVNRFAPKVKPESKEVIDAVEALL